MEKVESSTFFFQELLDRRIFRALCSSLKQGSNNSCETWSSSRVLAICRQETVASFPAGSGCELQESVAVGESLLDVPLVVGVCVVLAMCLAFCAYAPLCTVLYSVGIFARPNQMLVCSRSSSLLVLVEVRFPQNYVVLISGCCGVALWVEMHRLAVVFWWCFPELFVVRLRCIAWLPCVLVLFPELLAVVLVRVALKTNDALVVLVELLPEPVVLLLLAAVFSLLAVCFGCLFRLRFGDVFQERLLALWVEVLPCLVLFWLSLLSLCVEMSCRCCRLDCPYYSLPGRCRSRCRALGRVSGRGAGQVVFLFVFKFPRLRWWDFMCPQGWEVCFVSCALHALPNGSLVNAMGVWLFVLLWKRLVVRVSFLCFPLVAWGDVASLWCCVTRVRIVATFGLPLVKVVNLDPLPVVCLGWWCFHMVFDVMSHTVATIVAKVSPLLSCFEVEQVAHLVRVVFLWRNRAACPMFCVRQHRFSIVWLACASIVPLCVSLVPQLCLEALVVV
ncbi:hypothetical protein Taro_002246 [Colocasia esculenta]|uniref:Transmembrane protein n=1 Tax=Colocasia esculenta TaxID=4460 RepID=A0A843TK65_COLES|nr:hypothetical protein [Colocasia esculenta]